MYAILFPSGETFPVNPYPGLCWTVASSLRWLSKSPILASQILEIPCTPSVSAYTSLGPAGKRPLYVGNSRKDCEGIGDDNVVGIEVATCVLFDIEVDCGICG